MSAVLKSEVIPEIRPRLSLVPASEQQGRLPEAVYRRRRVAAVGIAVLIAITLWVVTQTIAHALSNEATATSMQPISSVQPVVAGEAGAYYTVRPGDTLWSIAQAVQPKGDFRPLLKRLDDRYGSTGVVTGQNILVS
jgi:LysM repeat protein